MMKILLAEDDLFLRDIYLEILKNENYEVTIAKDGNEALEKFKLGGWNLVLLDVIMPQMSGIDVLKNIEAPNSLTQHILFMTNIDEAKSLSQVIDITDGYILKSSVSPDQFLEKIKEVLKQ